MEQIWKDIFGSQFEAALDMLENALVTCPDELWDVRMWSNPGMDAGFSEFWYVAYHSLFWLDLYLSGAVDGYLPPAPFNLDELNPAGVLPEKPFSRAELLCFLEHSRRKCHLILKTLTDERAQRRCKFSWGEPVFAELLLDNMRHVQEHAAQLNMILGQNNVVSPGWIGQAKTLGLD